MLTSFFRGVLELEKLGDFPSGDCVPLYLINIKVESNLTSKFVCFHLIIYCVALVNHLSCEDFYYR